MFTPPPDSHSFSTPLKIRLVAYFRAQYDLDIKDEEADLFLRTLATVYDALSKDPRLSAAGQDRALDRTDGGDSLT